MRRRYNELEGEGATRTLTIEQLENLRLHDVVGRHDRGCVRLAATDEIGALVGDIGDGRDRGEINDWRLVAIDITGQPPAVMVLGEHEGLNYGTSPLRSLNVGSSRAWTQSRSIYVLGKPGGGEPPVNHVLHLCYMLHLWHVGEALDVPEVFY